MTSAIGTYNKEFNPTAKDGVIQATGGEGGGERKLSDKVVREDVTHQPNRHVELSHVPAMINTTVGHKIKVAPGRKTGTISMPTSANLPSRTKQKHPSTKVPLKIQAE